MKKQNALSAAIIFAIMMFVSHGGPHPALGAEGAPGNASESGTPREGTPRIEFYEFAHDLGKRFQNEEIEHIFRFKNTGAGTLTINNVKAG